MSADIRPDQKHAVTNIAEKQVEQYMRGLEERQGPRFALAFAIGQTIGLIRYIKRKVASGDTLQ